LIGETVFCLCRIPLDLPVNELMAWAQFTGDRRLSDALAECGERGMGRAAAGTAGADSAIAASVGHG
jgi:hypothetical protein